MTNLVASGNLVTNEEDKIEQTHKYKYLDHEIQICRGNQTSEVTRRIGLRWAAFGNMSETESFQSMRAPSDDIRGGNSDKEIKKQLNFK